MKTLSQIGDARAESTGGNEKGFAIETTFVLFFLAIEFGQTFQLFSLDGFFLALTLAAIAVLPYFLPSSSGEKPDFGNWLLGRSLITGFGILLGVMFKQSLGVVLPEMFRFLPMTLLIITAMLSCYIQFYSLLKLRFVK
jgi:hypothetical protein